MKVRQAFEQDVPRMLEISNWAALNTPANFATEPEKLDDWLNSFRATSAMYPWLAAEDATNGAARIIGFAKAGPHKSRCAYAYTAELSVYIDPEYHRRGVGSALYRALFDLLKAQGYMTAIAGITVPNPASEHLHEKFGMQRVALFARVGWKFDRWHDVGYWQAMLGESGAAPGRIRPVQEAMHLRPIR